MSDQDEASQKHDGDTQFAFGRSTRRTFLSRLGTASLLATAGPVATVLGQSSVKERVPSSEPKDAIPVTLSVNGKKHDLRIDPRTTLLEIGRASCRERVLLGV